MTVTEFEESYRSACRIEFDDEPGLVLPVASLEGIMIMKLIAWSERDPIVSRKDAADIDYLLGNYERIDADRGTLFETEWQFVMRRYDYNIQIAAAYLLGHRVRQIALEETLEVLAALLIEASTCFLRTWRDQAAPGMTAKPCSTHSKPG
ncbi:nucleotidyl transferase AbiEii/AbiGii toxin family protein [Larsenimonas rhizosphaerae]|uniref:Nucleotidyl transferase AbiEii/AbiGii toxin family protein n=1 Tax=Larsenimonas rhizosphaerae TaxID=2944682 RepID=A0AA41ZH70_9GAMM|nr:nucleotidyl transferase AbiEii/AbiGii toxin family protein [Larsenimonas rhizosphaerae]MCX2525197.1 nucleotidyl transferase AbiEii/AbiGii toxin family protein [Larsenimonas rhizosphaerae]